MKKFLPLVLLALFSCRNGTEETAVTPKTQPAASARIAAAAAPQLGYWMSGIEDSRLLKDMSIPGSHDAGAYKNGGGLAITQCADIAAQLESGSRYLDLRLVYDGSAQDLTVYHGIISQNLSYRNDVLPALVQFLTSHPTETVFLVVKNENGNNQAQWEGQIRQSLAENSSLFFTTLAPSTSLGEARGKIILISRSGLDGITARYTGIADNSSAFAQLGNAPVYFADRYRVPTLLDRDINKKAGDLFSALDVAKDPANTGSWATVNCNGTGLLAWPKDVADRINPKVSDYLEKNTAGRTGFVVIDFLNFDAGQRLVRDVISHN